MNLHLKDKLHLTDIRIWILLFFMIRLVGITNPPLETGHNWRQSLTCMVARNFYDGHANIFYPEIDYAGNQSGIIGSEFPIFNYLIYLVSVVFDYSHWYGRLINLVVSSIGIYFFYLLIKNLTTRKIAFNSSIILLASIWFAFSRKIMPDTFSVSLVMIGLYYGYRYMLKGSWLHLLLYFLLITLGILSKIPALYLLSLSILIFFDKNILISRKRIASGLTVISLGAVGWWYFYWVPYLLATYHNQLFFPRSLSEGFKEIVPLSGGFFRNFYFHAFYSYFAFACCLSGIYFVLKGSDRYLKAGILVLTITFILFILKTGLVFPLHNYYIIPFVPVMAFLAGVALARIPLNYQFIVLGLIVLEGLINQQHDFFIRKEQRTVMALEQLTERYTTAKNLIVINGGPSPQEIYFAHRKGWSVTNDKINNLSLDQYRAAGAEFLIINHKTFSDSLNNLIPLEQINEYSIYSLK